jgi:hypothetical protein
VTATGSLPLGTLYSKGERTRYGKPSKGESIQGGGEGHSPREMAAFASPSLSRSREREQAGGCARCARLSQTVVRMTGWKGSRDRRSSSCCHHPHETLTLLKHGQRGPLTGLLLHQRSTPARLPSRQQTGLLVISTRVRVHDDEKDQC